MTLRTALHEQHVALGGRMVDFAGWQMPLHYSSQIGEHHQVRRAAGMFDVSHMMIVDLEGARCREFLRYLLANDVGERPRPGRATYSCMLNEQGGVIDDLIVYDMGEDGFRMVVNAATRDKDLAWIDLHADFFGVSVRARVDLAMIAVQGPAAREAVLRAVADRVPSLPDLRPFHALAGDGLFVARTGYTGEDGFELILPGEQAAPLWRLLLRAGVKPCGLGARDTLRLEAGLNLYGSDMDETTTPLECGLAWTVAWDPPQREFLGRGALEAQRDIGPPRKLVGLVLEQRGVLRGGQRVICSGVAEEGRVTSGSFSPTLERAIALARLPAAADGACQVEIRGRLLPAVVVEPPFVRKGKSCL